MNTFIDRANEIADGDLSKLRGILLSRAVVIEREDTSEDALLIASAHVEGSEHNHTVEFNSHERAPDVLSDDADARALREGIYKEVSLAAGNLGSGEVGIDAIFFASRILSGVRTVGAVFGDGSWLVLTLIRREDYLGNMRMGIIQSVASDEVAGLEECSLISPENVLSHPHAFVVSRLDSTLRDITRFVAEPV